jgi:hypothetical protein
VVVFEGEEMDLGQIQVVSFDKFKSFIQEIFK